MIRVFASVIKSQDENKYLLNCAELCQKEADVSLKLKTARRTDSHFLYFFGHEIFILSDLDGQVTFHVSASL